MNQELLNEFLLESFENLSTMSEEITSLEKKSQDSEILNSIFRKVHTLKGSAGFLGFKKLQGVAHAAESLLDLMRENVISANGRVCDCLLEAVDACSEILKNIESQKVEPSKDYRAVVEKIQGLIAHSGKVIEEIQLVSGMTIPRQLFVDEEVKREKKTIPSPVIEMVRPNLVEVHLEAKKEMEIVQPDLQENVGMKNSNVADSVVRVNVQLLDKIMNVVGELVLSRNQILQYANSQDLSELNRMAQQLNTITSELQTDIMSTRMQPVGSVLSKFERIVRDLAKGQGKKIKLDIIGKETELDKTLLEAIRDPLTHLIRNSVDHGIENPEQRKLRGKSEEGRITIRSFHESGQVSIEISDDGNGIDPQKIMTKAIQKGILTAEQVKGMTPKQILQIIFMPGFSTAEQVTNISGRGVGMDVVKSNVEKIGGSVDITSEVGKGSTFKLKIPLTLAIVPALVVQDREETFAIPQVSLVELVRLDGGENSKIEKLYGSEFFRLRGNLIPVFRLSQSLGLSGEKSANELIQKDDVNIVVLDAEGKTYGLIVDLILDTEEIVVKPLSKELKKLSFYAGATIMGDGQVALILDAIGFYHFADKGRGQKTDQKTEKMKNTTIEAEMASKEDHQEFLICELGDRRQYAIPLLLVNRLEEFTRSQVEWSGDQALVKYGNYPMPLINLEESLHLKGNSLLFQESTHADDLVPCVVIRVRDHLYGLVVRDIMDIQMTDSMIHSDSVDRKGLLGTVFMKNQTTTILDIHSILEDQNAGKAIYGARKKIKNGKILMIEDSPLYQKIQKDFLEEAGYEVITAANGKEAMLILQSEQSFNLIVTDIEMPVMNGWDFAEELRKSEGSYKRIPIIAVSSKVSSQDKDRGVKCGFNEHLEKLNKVDLHRAILNYI